MPYDLKSYGLLSVSCSFSTLLCRNKEVLFWSDMIFHFVSLRDQQAVEGFADVTLGSRYDQVGEAATVMEPELSVIRGEDKGEGGFNMTNSKTDLLHPLKDATQKGEGLGGEDDSEEMDSSFRVRVVDGSGKEEDEDEMRIEVRTNDAHIHISKFKLVIQGVTGMLNAAGSSLIRSKTNDVWSCVSDTTLS